MTTAQQPLARALQRAFLVLQARIGYPGLIGIALLGVSAVVLGVAWVEHAKDPQRKATAHVAVAMSAASAGLPVDTAVVRDQPLRLPPRSDISGLLARVQRSALDQGLGWTRAEYRTIAASQEAPAAIEIRCVLKGAYPSLRQFVTALLLDTPTLTLREFALSRSTPEAAEVEAKLGIVIYVADETPGMAEARR